MVRGPGSQLLEPTGLSPFSGAVATYHGTCDEFPHSLFRMSLIHGEDLVWQTLKKIKSTSVEAI